MMMMMMMMMTYAVVKYLSTYYTYHSFVYNFGLERQQHVRKTLGLLINYLQIVYLLFVYRIPNPVTGADPGRGRWGARPPLGRSFTIQNALFSSIQTPVHHWAPTPGRNPVSAAE